MFFLWTLVPLSIGFVGMCLAIVGGFGAFALANVRNGGQVKKCGSLLGFYADLALRIKIDKKQTGVLPLFWAGLFMHLVALCSIGIGIGESGHRLKFRSALYNLLPTAENVKVGILQFDEYNGTCTAGMTGYYIQLVKTEYHSDGYHQGWDYTLTARPTQQPKVRTLIDY